MINELVVAVDGAEKYAEGTACCVDCAGRIAARTGARVSLVHVAPPATSDLASLTPYLYEGIIETAARDRKQRMQDTERELEGVEQRLAERWAVNADAEVAGGPLRTTTERLARSRHADLLVARGGDAQCPAGYLATMPDRVASDLSIPALFVRAGTCHMLQSVERVLVLLDGSASGEAALGAARTMLPAGGGLLHLLVVLPARRPRSVLRGRSAPPTSRDAAEAYLDGVAARPELADATIDWTVAIEGDIVETVCAVAESSRANLAAVSGRARAPLGRDSLRRLRERLTIPLLVCPAALAMPQ